MRAPHRQAMMWGFLFSMPQERDERGRFSGGGGSSGGSSSESLSGGGLSSSGSVVREATSLRVSGDKVKGTMGIETPEGFDNESVTKQDAEKYVNDHLEEIVMTNPSVAEVTLGNVDKVKVTDVSATASGVNIDFEIQLEVDPLEIERPEGEGTYTSQFLLGKAMKKQAHEYHTAKMERCLQHLKDQGFDAGSAHAICYATLGEEANKEFVMPKSTKPTRRNAEQEAKRERLRKDMQHKAELGKLAQQTLEELEGEEKEIVAVVTEAEVKEVKCDDEMGYGSPYIPYGGATSFSDAMAAMDAQAQANKMNELVWMYRDIIGNIVASETITDKGAAIADAAKELEALMKQKKEMETKAEYPWDDCMRDQMKRYGDEETARAVCGKIKRDSGKSYTPPTDKEYALIEEELKVKPRKSLEDKAGARHSAADQSNLDAAHDAIVKAGANCGMKMLKESDGSYRWFGWVSNKFRDRDITKHPDGEIITEAAHKEFISYLDANPDKAPEWWTWHMPVRKSRADWWEYSDGYLLASGPASEADAKGYLNDDSPIAMSHGFHALQRDSAKGLIYAYRAFEFSDLPPEAAANPYTSFEMVRKELTMFTPEKRAYLVKRLGEERVKNLENDTAAMGKALEESGVEWKEKETPAPAATVPNPADTEQAIAALKELFNVEGLNSVLTALQVSNTALAEQVKSLSTQLAEVKKTSDEKVAEAIAPRVKPIQWGYQASQAKESLVKEGDPLAKGAPDGWITSAFGGLGAQYVGGGQAGFSGETEKVN